MIILASGSWLRKTILESSEYVFKVDNKEIDERLIESKNKDKSDQDLAILLAKEKVKKIAKYHPNDLVIAADTFAVLPTGERLHKPKSEEEAIELCMMQSGKEISAVTGIAMAYGNEIITNTSTTKIKYVKFDRKTITKLLEGDDARIRNSGLGFFMDSPGFTLVQNFDGSYTGAMGLPMEIVRKNIKTLKYKNV